MGTDSSPGSARAAWADELRQELILRLRSVCPDLTPVEFEELIDGMVRIRLGDFGREQRNAPRLSPMPCPLPLLRSLLAREDFRTRVALLMAARAPQVCGAMPRITATALIAAITDVALTTLRPEARVGMSAPPRAPAPNSTTSTTAYQGWRQHRARHYMPLQDPTSAPLLQTRSRGDAEGYANC